MHDKCRVNGLDYGLYHLNYNILQYYKCCNIFIAKYYSLLAHFRTSNSNALFIYLSI